MKAKPIVLSILCVVIVCVVMQPVFAGGGKTKTDPEPSNTEEALTPEQEAIQSYNAGVSLRDTAWKLEKSLATATEEKQREKLTRKIPKTFERAAKEFELATQKKPAMFEAHSDLGYCLRRLGRYEEALAAYGTALQLSPNYDKAIEYRGEAYLGLNRVDDAKHAYMQLFQQQSDEAPALLGAMERWVEARREDAGTLDASTLNAISTWVQERAEIAGRSKSVSQLNDADW